VSKYRKKPVVIEATQWFKHGDHPEVQPYGESTIDMYPIYAECGWIKTLESGAQMHHVIPGDWIITGIQGEHYPCKPDIFAATYEPAD
jgi:hypothetical protein